MVRSVKQMQTATVISVLFETTHGQRLPAPFTAPFRKLIKLSDKGRGALILVTRELRHSPATTLMVERQKPSEEGPTGTHFSMKVLLETQKKYLYHQ